MGKKSAMPKLSGTSSGASSSSSFFRRNSSGVVSIRPQAMQPAAAPPPGLLSRFEDPTSGKRKREDTAGAAWGHMAAPTLTEELKRDLLVIKMRGSLDPKRFYRSSDDGKKLPKYFQMGTVIAGNEDAKLTRRERKESLFKEFMGDDGLRSKIKEKFTEHRKTFDRAPGDGRRKLKPRSKGKRHGSGKR